MSVKNFFTRFFSFFTLVVLGFCGGVWVSFLVGVGPEKIVIDRTVATGTSLGDFPIDFTPFRETYRLIKNNFFSFDTLSGKTTAYGIAKGFVESLGDRHTQFFDPQEAQRFQEALSGDFEGIGAYVNKADFGVYIEQIIAGSPAKEAGVQQGDVLIKANEVSLKELSLADAISHIRGPNGSWVNLEIIRPGKPGTITLRVQRRNIIIPSVDARLLDNGIYYIQLASFGEKTADEFKGELAKAYEKGAKGLIIDLRDNGGGYLETAVQILSQFLEKGRIVVTVKQTGSADETYTSFGRTWPPLPLVVLVNGNSASASEIMAGALKEHNIAVLVGNKTFGKGSVQQPFVLSDGSEVKITVAHWFTPDGKGIDGKGITPDVTVNFLPEDFDKKFDRQLSVAKKVLMIFIKQDISAARSWQSEATSGTGKILK